MSANARWQEIVSENLASAALPGYKKKHLSFTAVQAGQMEGPSGAAPVALPRPVVTTSFAPGEARYTGVNTDVAIDGSGFFQVQLPNGSNAYTRDGEFKLNAQGQLITKGGCLVLGDAGPIQLDTTKSEAISISSNGDISQGSEIRGRLKLVEFDDPSRLQAISGGHFIANDPNLEPKPVRQPSMRQGFIESSNTSAVMEMANLVRVLRGFESSQRLMQTQDERMGRAISELGSPT